MNVLVHGPVFWCGPGILERYQGVHCVKRLGMEDDADFVYDPAVEDATEIFARVNGVWPIDLFLCWFPEEHPPPPGIEEIPVKSAAMVGDWDLHYPALRTNLQRFDAILCDKSGVDVLRSAGLAPEHLFPLYSHDAGVMTPHGGVKDIDVGFVGTINPARHAERARLLERLANLSGRYRVYIAEGPSGAGYAQILSRCKLVFNMSARGELNARVFETLACRSCPMLETSNAEALDFFEEGREILFYEPGNLEATVADALAQPAHLEAMTRRGHRRAAELAGEHRLDAVIAWAEAQPAGARAFSRLDAREKTYQSALWYRYKRQPQYESLLRRMINTGLERWPGDPRFAALESNRARMQQAVFVDDAARWQAVVEFSTRAATSEPASAPYAYNAGLAKEQAGCLDGALASYEAGLSTTGLGGAELLPQRFDDVFWVRWQRGLALQEAGLPELHAEIHVRCGTVLCAQGEVQAAEKHFEAARDLDPKNVGGVRLWAELLWATHRETLCVELMLEHLGEHPFDLDYRKRLCAKLTELGRLEEAKTILEETLRIAEARQ